MAEQKRSDAEVLRALLTPDAAAIRRARRRFTAASRAYDKAVDMAFEAVLQDWFDDQIPDDPRMQDDWYAQYGDLDAEELAALEAEEEEEEYLQIIQGDPDDQEFDPETDLPPGVYEKLQAKAAGSEAVERAAQKRAIAELKWRTLLAMEQIRLRLGL